MFASNTFGQSSSPFGSQLPFGQTSNAASNPFAPKPFGGTAPFGSHAGGSLFGGSSTGMFGGTSTGVFGSTSSLAFGSSVPAFGASSSPAFGISSSSSSFGGSSVFGAKPAFSGFGSTPTQSSPFGSTFQQTQPAFGSSLFGSTSPFGASSQSAFGATSTPAFGQSSTPAFGQTSTPAFGATSTPAFGVSSTPAFGATSTPAFGATSTPAFGATSTPAFGATSTPAFGATSTAFGATGTPAFGATGTPAFGATGTPAFGATGTAFGASSGPAFGSGGAFGVSSVPAFGSSSTPAFGASSSAFGASSTPAFGVSSSPSFAFGSNAAFGSNPFGNAASPFGGQNTMFAGASAVQPVHGGQRGGSRVTAFTPTPELDNTGGTQSTGKLESISGMPLYKDKSHEELRWEDYQAGDKGGPAPASQPASGISFPGQNAQSNPFGSSLTFSQSSASPFSAATPSNPFAQKTQGFNSSPFAMPSTGFSSPFSASTSNPFGSAPSTTPSLFGSSTPGFLSGSSPSLFGGSVSSAAGSAPSFFNSSTAPGSVPSFGSGLSFGNTQSTSLFQSTAPAPALGQTSSLFGQSTSAFGQSSTPFGQSSTPFGQTNLFSTPSSGFGANAFSSSPSLFPSSNPASFGLTAPSLSTPFQSAQTASGFNFNNPAGTTGLGGMSSIVPQNYFGHPSALPAPVTNPFGTLPVTPQVSIMQTGNSPSIQYGISSLTSSEKPSPVRVSSLLTSRHLSQRRMKLPVRNNHAKSDGPKVPFFNDNDDMSNTPKADALFIPRENPRALVIRPMEPWSSRGSSEKGSRSTDKSAPVHENGAIAQNGSIQHTVTTEKPNRSINDQPSQKPDTQATLTGSCRAGEVAIVYEHGPDIETLMPKLRHTDYYTEPRIQDMAAKERAEPGFCRCVKDFVVGRHGYGSIRFLGETDVRRLDLESIVQFNDREVCVYPEEEAGKPPVGQGLNKPAEVTLLNINCVDKKTKQQYSQGPKVERYTEMLMRKTGEQGAEFLSYDAVKGEWKFRVSHFSKYRVGDDGDWDM